ncbi:MAG: rRNA adenine dimethyltransferase family protein, partial [Deltaproteobacteria bacterium]|nr:rRNA adenine dimethyltransferase family protein [Deltaproteobacteria bacterium]
VLEIGPGKGAITSALAEKCGELVLVEKDDRLAADLREKYSGRENVTVITGDFLKIQIPPNPPFSKGGAPEATFPAKFPPLSAKGRISPSAEKRGGRGDLKAVGNLPYKVASQIFIRLIENRTHFSDLFLMFQKEMALRFTAKPSTKDYGLLTLWGTIYSDAQILFHLPPSSFSPAPKVESSFVHFKIKDKPLLLDKEAPDFFKLMRRLFQQRRKTIQSVVKELRGKIPPTARAEAMTVEQLINLYKTFSSCS